MESNDSGARRFHPVVGALSDVWLGARLTVRDFIDDRGIDRSAALAYITLLSLVPLLATVAALYRAFFSVDTDRLVGFVTVVLPYQPGSEQYLELVETLTEFVNRATAIGYIGSLVFLIIAFRLFQSVETTFNDIWRIRSRRSAATRVFSFTMLVFWGPVVMGIGSSLLLWMGHQPWAPSQGLVLSMARLAIPLLGITMVYWLAPHTGVHIGAAVAGGLVAAGGLHLLRSLFMIYISGFSEVNIIYGSATLAVLFLVSLFAFWVIVIIGAEVSYVMQNFRALKLEHEGRRRLDADPHLTDVAVLTECFRRSLAGENPATLNDLEEGLSIRHTSAQRAAERMVAAGLLAQTGQDRDRLVPACEASSLTVSQALQASGANCADIPQVGSEALDKLGALLRRGETARQKELEGVTFADLLSEQ
jgi:membrane protein